MKSKSQILGGVLLLALLTFSGIATPFLGTINEKEPKVNDGAETPLRDTTTSTSVRQERTRSREMDRKLLEQSPNPVTSPTERISTQDESWDNPPGDWWNTSWEYRVNVTVTEPGIVNRKDWPVTVQVDFSPPAHEYSIRVVNASSGRKIPSQPWNLAYTTSNYLSSANVTFLVNVPQGSSRTYQVYWNVDSTDPPGYSTLMNAYETDGAYHIKSKTTGYEVIAGPKGGGKVINVTHLNGNEINQEIAHFGITHKPSTDYGDYWGEGDTNNNDYEYRGFVEEGNPLYSHYRGVIFARYQIRNIGLISGGTTLGRVNFTYTFYPSYWTVKESIRWEATTSQVSYYTGGWVFDQDDGDTEMFSYVADPEKMTNMSTPAIEAGLNLTVFDTSGYGDDYADDHSEMLKFTNESTSGVTVHSTTITTSSISWHDGEQPTSLDDYFSTEYQGLVYINETGTWEFGTDSDDASELMIDGTVVASWYGPHGDDGQFTPTHTGSITLNEGYHSFTYRQQECWGGEDGLAYWKAPNGSWDYIPGSAFYNSPENKPVSAAESEDYYNNATEWDRTAFFHHEIKRGIGVSWLSESTSGLEVNEKNVTWYNEGNDKADDYLYWAKRFNLNTSNGDQLSQEYAVIPWSPSGTTLSNRLSPFNDTYNATQHPLQTTKDTRERFKLQVTVNVRDIDDRGIEGAGVGLKDSHIATADTYNVSGTTNSTGFITFDVERVWYNITANLTSAGHTYYTNMSQNFSTIGYTSNESTITLDFSYLVQIGIHAQTNTSSPSDIQGGLIRFNNTTTSTEWNLTSFTNLTGWIEVFIPTGSWDLTMNATKDQPGWDHFTLYNVSTGKIIEGADSVRIFTLSLTTHVIYRVEDVDITTVTPQSELVWSDTPDVNPYWGENISGTVVFRDAENKDPLTGDTVEWYFLLDPANALKSGSGPTDSQGEYSFGINASDLPAGQTYTLKVNATPSGTYNKPVPLERSITVDPALTSLSISYDPGRTITWNESLTITAEYSTSVQALTPEIADATLQLTVTKGGYSQGYPLTETSRGTYQKHFINFTHIGTGDYTLTIQASKTNFTSIGDEKVLTVEARPTALETPASISVPWQDNITFTADYKDVTHATSVDIEEAAVRYEIQGEGISGTMSYAGGKYSAIIQIDGTTLTEGTYTLLAIAGKKNYENITTRTSFEIERRATYLAPNTTSVTKAYSEMVAIKFAYEDLDYAEYPFGTPYISGATTKYFSIEVAARNITGSLTDLGDGNYTFVINSTELGIGTWTLHVDLGKTHYESKSETVTVRIDPIPTSISASNLKPEVYWGKNAHVEVGYIDTLNNKNITGADVRKYNITDLNRTGILTWDASIGKYVFEYNTSQLVTQSYTITFTLSKANRTTQTITITLTVKPVPTIGSPSTTEITTYWGLMVDFTALYNISSTYNGTSRGWNANKKWYTVSDQLVENLTYTGAGQNQIRFNTSQLETKTYTITIYLRQQYFENAQYTVTLTVKEVPVDVAVSTTEYETYWGLMVRVNVTYNMSSVYAGTSIPVPADAVTRYTINGETREIGTHYWTVGKHELTFNSSEFSPGFYTIHITLGKKFYTNTTRSISLTVWEIPTIVNYPESKEVIWGDPLTLELEVINTLTMQGVPNLKKAVLLGNQSYTEYLTDAGNGTYVFNISTLMLEEGSRYFLNVTLTKGNYSIPQAYIEVEVLSLIDALVINYEEINTDIQQNPATREVSKEGKEITISIYDTAHGRAVTGATIQYSVEGIGTGTLTEGSIPGTYTAYIDWSKAEAGRHYEVTLKVVRLTIAGEEVLLSEYGLTVTGPSQGVDVDYWGGSIQIPIIGYRMANVWFFTMIGAIIVFAIVGSIKLYTYLTTPPEVRVLLELIERAKKEVFDYPIIDREEQFKNYVEEHIE